MRTQFTLSETADFTGLMVFVDGEPHTISSDHPSYDEIYDRVVVQKLEDDDEALTRLINPGKGVGESLSKLSERVTYSEGTILFDGDPLDNSLTEHIVRIIQGGEEEKGLSYQPFVNFLEKLATNPSKKSRKHLYNFIAAHGITILEDGDFLAYKGVNVNGTSIHSGYGIVDGVVFKNAHLKNEVGSVVEIPRSMVDDDRDVACSVGLHVGTHGYASSFASRLLNIRVNPRDVVSVPSDHSDAKIRVARYVVLEDNVDKVEVTTPTYVVDGGTPDEEPEDELDAGDSYDDDSDYEDEDEGEDELDVIAFTDPKVEAFYTTIKDILVPDGVKLGRYKNKHVTSARRDQFQEAIDAYEAVEAGTAVVARTI